MKKYILFLFVGVSILLQSCGGDQNTASSVGGGGDSISPAQNVVTDPAKAAKIEFAEKEFNFGTVMQGDVVTHIFKFKNTSNNPLAISNAVGSCGCTVPEYPKEPIAPGAEGEILVKFNSTNKSGDQVKKVTLQANTIPSDTELTIKAHVQPK